MSKFKIVILKMKLDSEAQEREMKYDDLPVSAHPKTSF